MCLHRGDFVRRLCPALRPRSAGMEESGCIPAVRLSARQKLNPLKRDEQSPRRRTTQVLNIFRARGYTTLFFDIYNVFCCCFLSTNVC